MNEEAREIVQPMVNCLSCGKTKGQKMTDRDDLIEKMALAIYIELHSSDDPETGAELWREHRHCGHNHPDHTRALISAEAALAVVEEAHAPTDDEQEALDECSCKCGHLYHSECYPRTAEWGGCFDPEPTDDEREVQGWREAEAYADDHEPSKRAETADDFMAGWRAANRTRRTVQGEPSDDEQKEALLELYTLRGWMGGNATLRIEIVDRVIATLLRTARGEPRTPDGWFPLGSHAPYPWVGRLEFSEETDDAGMPLWERPVQGDPTFTNVVADLPVPEGCPGVGVQGEPSDAAVDAALEAAENAGPLAPIRERLRAALRAAAEAEGGNR